jgi:hypothetical protein
MNQMKVSDDVAGVLDAVRLAGLSQSIERHSDGAIPHSVQMHLEAFAVQPYDQLMETTNVVSGEAGKARRLALRLKRLVGIQERGGSNVNHPIQVELDHISAEAPALLALPVLVDMARFQKPANLFIILTGSKLGLERQSGAHSRRESSLAPSYCVGIERRRRRICIFERDDAQSGKLLEGIPQRFPVFLGCRRGDVA